MTQEDIVSQVQSQTTSPQAAPSTTLQVELAMPKGSQIIKESIEIYKKKSDVLLAIGLAPFLLGLVFNILYSLGYTPASQQSGAPAVVDWIFLGPALVLLVPLIISSVWAWVATLVALKKDSEVLSATQAYALSKRYIFASVTTGLLGGLMALGGFILFIVPGILFSLWYSQSGCIVVDEDLKNMAALRRSKFYTKGRLGSVFAKSLLFGICYIGVFLLASFVAGIIIGILKLPFASFASLVAGSTIGFLLAPAGKVFAYQLFSHLKRTRPYTGQ